MPKVTLLGKAGRYDIVFGHATYPFSAGVAKIVPVQIALIAQKSKDERGQKRFLVEDMPTVVKPMPMRACKVPEQNEPAHQLQHRQRVFEKWPSELM